MLYKLQFLKDTSTAIIPPEYDNNSTVVVYREGYKLPKLNNVEYIEFEKYRYKYYDMHHSTIIIVGINKIITPSTRTNIIFEYIQENSNSIEKIIIDTAPFVGEPWRFWWAFSITNNNPWLWPHSYTVETEWKHWFLREEDDCQLSAKKIKGTFDGVYSDLDKIESTFSFRSPSDDEIALYDAVKETAFQTNATPKTIINYMIKNLANSTTMNKVSFDDFYSNKDFVWPEFGVYKFIAEENIRRMDFYNTLIGKGV